MPTEVLVNPHVFYQGADALVPVRNSHVYIDLPTDQEGFLHARTDENGRLCNVDQEKRGARGAGPLFVPLEREKPFAIYCDDGVVPKEGLPHLGGSAHAAKLEERDQQGRKQAFFRVPPRPFDIVIERLEVSFSDEWALPRDEATGMFTKKPSGPVESVDPYPPKPPVFWRPKGSKAKVEAPPRKPPSDLRILEIVFRGFPANDPRFRIDSRIGLDVEPDYVKRVMAQAVYEEAHASARMDLDEDAHAFIKRRYPEIDTLVPEWSKRLDKDPSRDLVWASERRPGIWEAYGRRPARRVFDWQPDFLDRLWLELELDPAARVTPDLELESWTAGTRFKRKRKLIDILVHNRQVLMLDALIASVGDHGGNVAPPILDLNVDQGVMAWLPALREACVEPLRCSERFSLYAQAVWPDALAWPPIQAGADGLLDPRAYLAALDRERAKPFAPNPAYVDAVVRQARGAASSFLRIRAEGLWGQLSALARGLRKQAEAVANEWGGLEWKLGKDAKEAKVGGDLANRTIGAQAATAYLRFGLARMEKLATDRLDAVRAGWAQKLTRHAEALGLCASAKRNDLRELLVGWELERAHMQQVATTRCDEAKKAWTAARERADACLDHAARVAAAARARAASREPVGDALASAVDAAETAVAALAKLVDAAADAEATGGDRPSHGNAEETAADALHALALTRCEEILDVHRMAHHHKG